MKWINGKALTCILAASLLLSGCSQIGKNELITGAATTGAAVVSTVAGLGTAATAAVTGATAVASSVATTEPVTVDEAISALPPEQQVEALKNQQLWHTIEVLGFWAFVILGGILAVIWFIPSPMDVFRKFKMNKHIKKLERHFDDVTVKMKDLDDMK